MRRISPALPALTTLTILAALAALAALTALTSLATGCASSAPRAGRAADLTNAALGPEYAQWLIGPVAVLATPAERQAYLAIGSDAEAERFVADFWARRDSNPRTPENETLQLFDRRTLEADRLYSEGGVRGRRTDRGMTLVLFGAPSKVEFEASLDRREGPIEVWTYPAGTRGLVGLRPSAQYRFVKRAEFTVFYRPLAGGEGPPVIDAVSPLRRLR